MNDLEDKYRTFTINTHLSLPNEDLTLSDIDRPQQTEVMAQGENG